MPTSKSLTPAAGEHPAHTLSIGADDDVTALSKLGAAALPNDALVERLRTQHPKEKRWRHFRTDYRYLYVMSWMQQCRGYVRLGNEPFDVDLFEIELFNLVHPPPVDDMALLANKTRLALLGKVHGKKLVLLGLFDTLFRVYFGTETPLGGADDMEVDSSAFPTFSDLYIDEKIDVLFTLMAEVAQNADFRDFLDKSKLAPNLLRAPSIFHTSDKKTHSTEDYLLFFDNTALYKRVATYPELVVPKKRSLAPEWPEEEWPEEAFDVADVQFELVYKDVYGLDEFIELLQKNRKSKRSKQMLDVLAKRDFVANAFAYEIRKRRTLAGRRREFELARLMATRKRSSRLEAKEKQKYAEEQARKLRELEELQYATARRSQRARTLRQTRLQADYSAGHSREERLRVRKGFDLGVEVVEGTPEPNGHGYALDADVSNLEASEPAEAPEPAAEFEFNHETYLSDAAPETTVEPTATEPSPMEPTTESALEPTTEPSTEPKLAPVAPVASVEPVTVAAAPVAPVTVAPVTPAEPVDAMAVDQLDTKPENTHLFQQ